MSEEPWKAKAEIEIAEKKSMLKLMRDLPQMQSEEKVPDISSVSVLALALVSMRWEAEEEAAIVEYRP